jgi:hypothetical protein
MGIQLWGAQVFIDFMKAYDSVRREISLMCFSTISIVTDNTDTKIQEQSVFVLRGTPVDENRT